MLAPSYNVLMDFEGQMAAAFANVFTQAGLNAPLGIQSSAGIKTPEYAFHFASGGVLDGHEFLVNGFKVYDHFKGNLDVFIYMTRSENTASNIGLYRSYVRQIFNTWRGRFASQDSIGNPLCPYYQILSILERGVNPTVDAGEDMDLASMTYEVKFRVNPDAWPAQINQQVLIQTTQ